jgi:hypothetical protein
MGLLEREELEERLIRWAHELYQAREEELGQDVMRGLERALLLRIMDTHWGQHLTAMENMRQGIGLYGVKVGSKSQKAHVAVIIRLIDTTTTEVLASQRVEGEAKSGGLSFSAAVSGVDFGQDSFSKTPMGKATQMAIDQAVEFISGKMQDVAWKGKVIKTEADGNILINAGQTAGMQAGTVLKVSRPGEPVLDPDTGMELGAELTELGSVKIAEVLEKYSKAKAEQPLKQPAQAGDVLEIVAA